MNTAKEWTRIWIKYFIEIIIDLNEIYISYAYVYVDGTKIGITLEWLIISTV